LFIPFLAFNPDGSFAQMLVTIGGYLSLILIVVAFCLITLLSMRSSTIRSFQFELFVFVLVLFITELPYILGNLGLLNMLTLEYPGLVFHSVSMGFLSFFILARSYKVFGGRKKLLSDKKQDEVVHAKQNPPSQVRNDLNC
jgi:hypothetical protein